MVCPCTMLVPMVALAPLAEKACASPMGRATMTALAPFLLLAAAMAGGYVEAAQVSVRQGWSRSSDLSVVASPCSLALAFASVANPRRCWIFTLICRSLLAAWPPASAPAAGLSGDYSCMRWPSSRASKLAPRPSRMRRSARSCRPPWARLTASPRQRLHEVLVEECSRT